MEPVRLVRIGWERMPRRTEFQVIIHYWVNHRNKVQL